MNPLFNWDLQVPYGYGSSYRSLRWVHDWLLEHHHPEYVRRLVAWLHYKNGEVGPGGGWRADGTQPDKEGFAPEGRSFHQNQIYTDGFVGAVAVDTVFRDGPDPGTAHDWIPWREVPAQGSAEAARWGIHANVGAPGNGESWHIQPIEIDGWGSATVNGTRPAPAPEPNYPIPYQHDPYGNGDPVLVLHSVPQYTASDTRVFPGGKMAGTHNFGVGDRVPEEATHIFATITAIRPDGDGFVSVAAQGQNPDGTSCLNYAAGQVIANTTMVPVLDRHFAIHLSAATHVKVDVLGYFTEA